LDDGGAVHRSEILLLMSVQGQLHTLLRCSIAVRFTPVSGIRHARGSVRTQGVKIARRRQK